MFWFFGKKRQVEKLEEEVKDSFDHVKQDFNKVGQWISHLDGKHKDHETELEQIKDQLDTIQFELHEIKEFISFFGPKLSKQPQTAGDKQTDGEAVQMPVQTAVQTGILSNLTVMERAIVWALVNSEMNLSYEDLAALLGKDKSTIRGQINTIKQKSEGLIEERVEVSGKKRLYIPEKMKDFLVKTVKVRVKSQKKAQKTEKNA
jgi:predicted transcriptional regulator